MKVFISNSSNTADLGAIVSSHKARLGNKYAFLFNKEVIGQAKSNSFQRPPKRSVLLDLDSKLEFEANTSASSGDTADQVVKDVEVKDVIAAGSDNQAATTKKLLDDLLSYEEFLSSSGLATGDTIREVRKFTRFLIANVLKRKEDFWTIARESISLGAILLAAEKFELNLALIFSYIAKEFQAKRITKLSKVRETKAYSLLTSIGESYEAMPSSP